MYDDQPTDPFLLTIPPRAAARTLVPEGWSTLQIGRESPSGDQLGHVGLVCFDPDQHQVASWLSPSGFGDVIAGHDWEQAFEFDGITVWYRPFGIGHDL